MQIGKNYSNKIYFRTALTFLFSQMLLCTACRTEDEASLKTINGTASDKSGVIVMMMSATASDGSIIGGGVCTGAKIADDLILTAAHCISEIKPLTSNSTRGVTKQLRISNQKNVHASANTPTQFDLKKFFQVTIVEIKGARSLFESDGKTLRCPQDKAPGCRLAADVALMRVQANPEFAQIPILDVSTEPVQDDEELNSFGFGCENLTTKDSFTLERRFVPSRALAVAEVDARSTKYESKFLDYDLTQGKWHNAFVVGTGQENTEIGSATCSGDSGGPVFNKDGKIVAVNSRGNEYNKNPKAPFAPFLLFARLSAARDLFEK